MRWPQARKFKKIHKTHNPLCLFSTKKKIMQTMLEQGHSFLVLGPWHRKTWHQHFCLQSPPPSPTTTPISSSLRRYLTLCDFNFVSFHYVQVFTSCAFLWLNGNFRPRLLFKLRLQLNINRSSESFLASKHVENRNPASLVNTSAFFPATPGRKPQKKKQIRMGTDLHKMLLSPAYKTREKVFKLRFL